MSIERILALVRLEWHAHVRSPLFGGMALLACTFSMILNPVALIPQDEAAVAAMPLWVNSSHAAAQLFCLSGFMLYTFFASIMAGMSTIRDDEASVSDLLHSTPLTPAEYVTGKLGGAMIALGALLGVHVLFVMAYLQFRPINSASLARGPFELTHFIVPALAFAVPGIWLSACLAFAVGERTRKPLAMYVVPTVLFMASAFIVFPPPTSGTPTMVTTVADKLLVLLDPSGLRWLRETAFEIDRGPRYYNESPIAFDGTFGLRLLILLGLPLFVAWTAIPHCRSLARGQARVGKRGRGRGQLQEAVTTDTPAITAPSKSAAPLATLGMKTTRPGFFRGALGIARVELHEVRHQPGIYLLVAFAMLMVPEAVSNMTDSLGTPLLLTAGVMGIRTLSVLTLLGCLVLMFHSVESFERERTSGFDALLHTTPVRTSALFLGKGLGAAAVAVALLAGGLAVSVMLLAIQGGRPFEVWPLIWVWSAVLPATYFLWNAFIAATLSVVRERFTVYVIGLGTLLVTFFAWQRGTITWATNWPLWGALRWSDMAFLDLNGRALLLNRATAVATGIFLTAVAVQLFARREPDDAASRDRVRPRAIAQRAIRLAPFALLPLIIGGYLATEVRAGFQSRSANERAKAYWRTNVATWLEVETAAIRHVELEIDLEPANRTAAIAGTYTMTNGTGQPLKRLPFTVRPSFGEVAWALQGHAIDEDNRAGLHVITPATPIAPGATFEVGFAYQGTFPRGMTKRGRGVEQFVLPSGVALHTLRDAFLPTPGFVEGIGIDDGNRYDPPSADDQGIGRLERQPPATQFTTNITATAPSAYTVNSVGTKVSEETSDGRTTVVWRSDHPVGLINIVAGRWDVRRRGDTAVFFHPTHDANVDLILDTLVAARDHYSRWFSPYPWRELRLSEFPNHVTNAQGFPTNIPFSEGIGFLNRPSNDGMPFSMVTAHEAAHQWWGNIVGAAVGPGTAHLIEGMAHYSALLLQEAMNGEQGRIALATTMEENYRYRRRAVSERPVAKMVDDQTAADWTVVYEKGAWVMWMLQNHLGRDAMLTGIQRYVDAFRHVDAFHRQPRLPTTQDLLAILREQTTDPEAYDAFVDQWFFDVVLPEFQLRDVNVEPTSSGWSVTATVENVGTGDVEVEIAIAQGTRFADTSNAPRYRDARQPVRLRPGAPERVSWTVPFQPEQLVVDPDALVFQHDRSQATVALDLDSP